MWLEHENCTSVVELGWDRDNPLLSLSGRTKNCSKRLKGGIRFLLGTLTRVSRSLGIESICYIITHNRKKLFGKYRPISASLMSCSSKKRFSGSKDPELCGSKMETETHPSSIRRPLAEKEEIPSQRSRIGGVNGLRVMREWVR
ncbi:hypothetical protein ACS0TY_013052 [Phlomoides rotata]